MMGPGHNVNKHPKVLARASHVSGRLLAVSSAVALAATFSSGCSKDKEATDDTKAVTKSVVMRTVNPTPELVAQGKAAFGACAGCHGAEGEGRIGIGPRLASETFLAAASDAFLIDNITNGRAGTTMIPWGASYDAKQIKALVAYLRSLQPTKPAVLKEHPLAGDVEIGKQRFRSVCASCHGRSGAGYQETANGTGIGRKVFLDKASNGFLRHIIAEGKSHTAMRGFGGDDPAAVANFDDEEVDSLIAYLRKEAW